MMLLTNTENSLAIPPRLPRRYIDEKFCFQTWNDIEPFVQELIARPIASTKDLQQLMLDCDELDRIIGEESCRRRIKVTQNTADQTAAENLNAMIMGIWPKLDPLSHRIHQKMFNNPFLNKLDEKKYYVHIRHLKNRINLYRDENIALSAELALKEKQYRIIAGNMTVWLDNEELTLQQASQKMRSTDRDEREKTFRAINECWLNTRADLDNLYDELRALRQKVAENAGYDNFRDFKFAAMGRYDYTPQDCYNFHDTIAQVLLPVSKNIQERKREAAGIEPYRPWDTQAALPDRPVLKPFKDTYELTEKTIQCLEKISPEFADNLRIMRSLGNLDLDSRKNKAPGGYNSSLPESGVPFIFMNAVGSEQDVKTMVHESGHAMHTFLSRHLELMTFKKLPSEIAELASMSMELMSMEHWDTFYDSEKDLVNAKIQQLERVIELFPWVATVDAFQHWIYTHPQHTRQERTAAWESISNRFSTHVVDWSGLENYHATGWHKQLHIFEVPFYYVEYAIAQLGAIAVWQQYKQNPEMALRNYKKMLQLGYSQVLPELYEAAGIRFDFSVEYVQQLSDFVADELQKLYAQAAQLSNMAAEEETK
jgi:oligoendopeptidase F